MKASTLLRKAKKHLCPSSLPSSETSNYICLALYHAADSSKRNWDPVLDRLRYHIDRALHPHSSFTRWLQCQLPKEEWHGPHEQYLQIQAHRKAWVDRLIAEFESEGD